MFYGVRDGYATANLCRTTTQKSERLKYRYVVTVMSIVSELWNMSNAVLDLELETEDRTDRTVTCISIEQNFLRLSAGGDC
jgi:hypothetical protein